MEVAKCRGKINKRLCIQSCIVCLSFLHRVFTNVSSNRQLEIMQSHIACICLTFLHCASQMFTEPALISTGKVTRAAFILLFSSVSFQMYLQMAGLQPERIQSHTGCICLVFLHCAFPNVYSKSLGQRRQSHTGCIFFVCVIRWSSKCLYVGM